MKFFERLRKITLESVARTLLFIGGSVLLIVGGFLFTYTSTDYNDFWNNRGFHILILGVLICRVAGKHGWKKKKGKNK